MAHVPGACTCVACSLARDRKAPLESANSQNSRPSDAMATPTYPPTSSAPVCSEPVVYTYGSYGVCGERDPFWSGTRGFTGIAMLMVLIIAGALGSAPSKGEPRLRAMAAAESGVTRAAPSSTASLGVSLEDLRPDDAAPIGLSPGEG